MHVLVQTPYPKGSRSGQLGSSRLPTCVHGHENMQQSRQKKHQPWRCWVFLEARVYRGRGPRYCPGWVHVGRQPFWFQRHHDMITSGWIRVATRDTVTVILEMLQVDSCDLGEEKDPGPPPCSVNTSLRDTSQNPRCPPCRWTFPANVRGRHLSS